MSLTIDLPTPLGEELAIEAEREGVSVSDQAVLLLYIITSLTRNGRKTPFRSVVRSFLERNEIDPDRMGEVFEGLVKLCGAYADPGKIDQRFEDILNTDQRLNLEGTLSLLRGWKSPEVHRSVSEDIGISTPPEHPDHGSGRVRHGSAMGKYAWLRTSSRDYAAEKLREIAREDRPR